MNNDAFEKLEDDEGIEDEEVEVEGESSQASPLQVGSKDMCSRTSSLCKFARMRRFTQPQTDLLHAAVAEKLEAAEVHGVPALLHGRLPLGQEEVLRRRHRCSGMFT